MFFMAYRLVKLGRRKAYRNLLVSVGFISLYHLFRLAVSLEIIPQNPSLQFASRTVHALAFILLNFAFFELYYKRRPRTRAWFFGLLAVGLTIAACDAFAGNVAGTFESEGRGPLAPVLDGFVVLLGPLFALMFAPHIRQSRRYVLSLALATCAQITGMAVNYYGADSTFYAACSVVLPIGSYILLFMLLFERVVELLQSAYRSSITDGLTNLYNRRFFMTQLDHALKSGHAVGAIFCDIDNFKKLNDTQGHQQADVVLKQVAAILMEETEGVGLAGRYGGEELVAFISHPTTSSQAVAELIRARIAKETIVTVSVGHCQSRQGIFSDQLMKFADQAMYHSKRSGKNRLTDYATIADGTELLDNDVPAGLVRTKRR
ncbi:hypothetical protein AXX17_ATUG04350 [Arabidopsis thaliana]|uniref:GGDEF domain-containing protein n=1 Tax=Arabidopsis thaliana TaxID=3702 RepID=A0A178U597_ARATH|nr:hypothetical protein AXX17_ATUG04350 [Arabidopsis thaliana]